MLAHEVVSILGPFKNALPKNSYSAAHRCLEISDVGVRCKTSHVAIDIAISLGIVDYMVPIHVDGTMFLTVLNSLPETKELKLAHRDNALHWNCGNTKGKMACIDLPTISSSEYLSLTQHDSSPTYDFLTALELGSLSVDTNTMASVGMSGVMIDTDLCLVAATDDVTISACWFKNCLPHNAPPYITLSPETVSVLSTTLGEQGYWDIDDSTIKYSDGICDIIVSQVAPLTRQNVVLSLIRKCEQGTLAFQIPGDTIRAFIKRAEALSQSRPQLNVTIGVQDDRVTLEFDEMTAQTQEYFTVANLNIKEPLAIKLNARKFTRALKYSSEIVLDFMAERILVLRATNHDFMYIIGGR